MKLKNHIKEFNKVLGEKESFLDKNHPRIAENLLLHWGYKEIHQFINKLLIVDKERDRQGFALEALKEIYLLQEIHNELFPALRIQGNTGSKNWRQDQKSRSAIYY